MKVFCLVGEDGRLLDPSVQATVLAKYSRSPLSAAEILKSISAEEADRFHHKWTVGYGHSSVAELASLPICYEGVSIVASKFLEQGQRSGYSEKSTRYQKFSADSFVTPPGAPATMKAFAARFYAAYDRLYPRVARRCAELMGLDPNDPAVLEKPTVKARTFDNVRYLLPAGTGTNLAASMNLRDARYLAREALGHSNPEIVALGRATIEAASGLCPALMGKVEPDEFEPRITSVGRGWREPIPRGWDVELDVPASSPSHPAAIAAVMEAAAVQYGMTWEAFSRHMESRGDRQVPKIFKLARVRYRVTMDYGAYRDLQRHRRCEQYAEPLTADLGYVVPDDIAGTNMEREYRDTMESVHEYDDHAVVFNSDLLQYMIPLGYLHRSIFDMDLREMYYLTELRTKPQGHISYRRVAYAMFQEAEAAMGELTKWCRAVKPDSIGEHR